MCGIESIRSPTNSISYHLDVKQFWVTLTNNTWVYTFTTENIIKKSSKLIVMMESNSCLFKVASEYQLYRDYVKKNSFRQYKHIFVVKRNYQSQKGIDYLFIFILLFCVNDFLWTDVLVTLSHSIYLQLYSNYMTFLILRIML